MSEERKHTSNSTWAGMIALRMRVTVYCTPCNRSVELDLTKFPPEGKAIGVKFRCSQCGGLGHSIVSPIFEGPMSSNLVRRR